MIKINCDWCKKSIKESDRHIEPAIYNYGVMWDLCNECEDKYEEMRERLAKYREECLEEVEKRAYEKAKELFKKEGIKI